MAWSPLDRGGSVVRQHAQPMCDSCCWKTSTFRAALCPQTRRWPFTPLLSPCHHSWAPAAGVLWCKQCLAKKPNFPRAPSTCADLVSAALLVCSIATFIQVTGFNFKHRKFSMQLGSGLLSVMGISFTPVPVFQAAIASQMVRTWGGRGSAAVGCTW